MARQEFPDESRYQVLKEESIAKQTNAHGEAPLNRKPDVSVYDKQEKRIIKVYEAGHVDKSTGQPVKRERAKQIEYNARGIRVHFKPVRK